MAIFDLTDPIIRSTAKVFADEFANQGLFAGGQPSRGEEPTDERTKREAVKTIKDAKKERDAALKQSKKLRKAAGLLETKYKHTANAAERAIKTHKRASILEQKANFKYRTEVKRISSGIQTFGQRVKSAGSRLAEFGKSSVSFTAAIALLGTAATKGANDLRAQLKTGAIDTGNVLDQMGRAWRLGVDPELLSELQSQNRAAVVAMGGVTRWGEQLDASRRTIYTYTGDLDDAIRFTSQSLQTMRIAGITPTTEMLHDSTGKLQGFGQTIRNIHITTGKTFSEIDEMLRGFIETEEVRFRLAGKIDAKGRRQALQEIAKRQELLLGLGMTAEQATRAGQALDQLAGKGPKERMKEAARARAMMGMMGMQQEGADIQKLMILGQRRTAEQDAQLAVLQGKIQQKAAEAQMGPLGQEFAVMSVYQKLGLDQNKSFLVLASDEAKQRQKDVKDKKTVGENNKKLVSTVFEISTWLKRFKDNPIMQAIAGTLMGIGATAKLILGAMALRGLRIGGGSFRNVMGGRGPMGRFGGALGLGGQGAASRVATSALGKIALPALMLVGAFQTLSETAKESAKQAGALGEVLGGTGAGNKLISFFRNIGDLATFGFAEGWGTDLGKWGANIGEGETGLTGKARVAQEAKAMKWAREAGGRRSDLAPSLREKQAELSAAFMDIATIGGELTRASEDNPQLDNIAVLLKELNISNDKAAMFSKDQIGVLAEIASDGKISEDERRRAQRSLGAKAGRGGRTSATGA